MKELNSFVNNLIKSIKNHKLYQKVSDTTREFIEKSLNDLKKVHEEMGPIILSINEDKIMNDSQVLHVDPKRLTSIPLFLYRNGIRSLTFLEGISEEEIEAIVSIIANREYSSKVGLIEDLWEARFPHIIYHAVEKIKKPEEYKDFRTPSGLRSNQLTVLPVKLKKKGSPKEDEGKVGIVYKPQISIDRERAPFLLIESIQDLLLYEQNKMKRKSLYEILKDSIPKFLSSGNLSALYQTKRLIENLNETKNEFIKISNEIKEIITSETALQLYIHALTSTNSNRIRKESVEMLEYIGMKAADSLINELEITSDFVVKDLIISLLKNIFFDRKEELEARLIKTKGKAFLVLLSIVKKLKDPFFIPCLKELFEENNSPQVKEALFSILSRKDLLDYLNHHDSSVRVIVLSKLKAIWTPAEFEIVRDRILSKNFWHLSHNEIKTLLELLSTLTTDDTIKIFNKILSKKHFFNKNVYTIKNIAIKTLSNIKDDRAIEIIKRYRKSKHLKETVEETLKNHETE
jgi:hypothetical protein